jgi:hypothetical protein
MLPNTYRNILSPSLRTPPFPFKAHHLPTVSFSAFLQLDARKQIKAAGGISRRLRRDGGDISAERMQLIDKALVASRDEVKT